MSNGVNGTNRFTSTDFGYDKNGNVITDRDPITTLPRQFIFNGDNKQIEITSNGTTVGRYFYDGEGMRVKKVVGNETTVFVYSSGKLIAEYSTTAPPATGHINYTTTDHLGSPRIITDQFGQVKSRRDFMPFGEDLFNGVGNRSASNNYSPTGDDIKQKFTGYLKDDETSLDFAEARMYENRHGRFTAVDPLLSSGKSSNPQTFNRFVYVGNSPVVTTDPLGLDWFRKGNKFQWSADNKVFDDGTSIEGWDAVQFGNSGYYSYDCEGCYSGQKAYLYQVGGWDNGLRARVFDSLMENARLANSFNDPKLLAIRHPEVAERGGDAMWMGAAILNIPPATYNLGASGVNYFGGSLPYAPTIEPDENTSAAGKFFFYGTNGALAIQGGVSAFRGIRNFFSLDGATNLASAASTNHILAGDAFGGGHAWFRSARSTWNGISRQKSMFPVTWSNKKIMNAISEVATGPNSTWANQSGRSGSFFTNAGSPARFKVEGVFANRRIRVIVQGQDIHTGFPIK